MKNLNFQSEKFRQMSYEEAYSCTGGGFAYDAGRFLRFAAICGPGYAGVGGAMIDFVYNSIVNKV